MTDAVPRAVVEAFYQAYVSRDPQRIGACLDEEVEWHVAGPVGVMLVCGFWRGKAAVIDRFARQVPHYIDFKSLEPESLLVDGDSSALLGRVTSLHRQTGRLISHRVAHFVRYRDEKVISYCSITDSLDAAEQFMNRRIDLATDAAPGDGDVYVI